MLSGSLMYSLEWPVIMPFCLPQIPHGLMLDRTLVFAAGGQRLSEPRYGRTVLKGRLQCGVSLAAFSICVSNYRVQYNTFTCFRKRN
jgi:hypothetical protein